MQIRGESLEVVESGEGAPVILVHGSVSDLRTWAKVQPELSEHARVISYSRRYHWPNASIPEGADYSMVEHVDDLEALIDRLGNPVPHLVGHSYGAYVAVLLAIRRPDMVRTLVLAEPPMIPLFVDVPPGPWALLGLFLRNPKVAMEITRFAVTALGPATRAFERGDREEGQERFGRAVLGSDAYERLSDERREQVWDNLIEAEFLGSGFVPVAESDVESIEQPTLLLGAEDSPRLFGHVLDRLEGLMPVTTRSRVPDASHILHEDNPEAFVSTTLRFLDSSDPAS